MTHRQRATPKSWLAPSLQFTLLAFDNSSHVEQTEAWSYSSQHRPPVAPCQLFPQQARTVHASPAQPAAVAASGPAACKLDDRLVPAVRRYQRRTSVPSVSQSCSSSTSRRRPRTKPHYCPQPPLERNRASSVVATVATSKRTLGRAPRRAAALMRSCVGSNSISAGPRRRSGRRESCSVTGDRRCIRREASSRDSGTAPHLSWRRNPQRMYRKALEPHWRLLMRLSQRNWPRRDESCWASCWKHSTLPREKGNHLAHQIQRQTIE